MEAKWRLRRRLEKQKQPSCGKRGVQRQFLLELGILTPSKVRVDSLAGRGHTITIEKAETTQKQLQLPFGIETNSPMFFSVS